MKTSEFREYLKSIGLHFTENKRNFEVTELLEVAKKENGIKFLYNYFITPKTIDLLGKATEYLQTSIEERE